MIVIESLRRQKGGLRPRASFENLYDNFFNPNAQVNPEVTADGPPWDGLPASAKVTLPANSILVFAKDHGDF